ncbi:MAG: prepilin-type N-terminal cleavage/methylation domain-containing protein [Planctomycetota bacterium]
MKHRGFTLLEVLIAMALFLFGMMGLLALFQTGGNLEASAHAHARLAAAIEPLVRDLRADAWRLDPSGSVAGLREIRGEPVPGALGYHYELRVEPPGEDASLRRAVLVFYRNTPERPVERLAFLLPRRVPLSRRLEPPRQP